MLFHIVSGKFLGSTFKSVDVNEDINLELLDIPSAYTLFKFEPTYEY